MHLLRNSLRAVLIIWLFGRLAAPAVAEIFSLPLTKTNGWQFLTFRKIPPNTFRATPDGLEIGVTNSAAPAVFPLRNGALVTELRVTGRISGSLNLPPDQQGKKGFDDYTVRIGLVESGRRTLSWSEKAIAAGWVKRLFALAPPGTGISQIHFFNLGTAAAQIGTARIHPASEWMHETVVAVPDSRGSFSFTNRFARPLQTIAVWVSCDGDDTQSSFAVKLSKIELSTENAGEGFRTAPK